MIESSKISNTKFLYLSLVVEVVGDVDQAVPVGHVVVPVDHLAVRADLQFDRSADLSVPLAVPFGQVADRADQVEGAIFRLFPLLKHD